MPKISYICQRYVVSILFHEGWLYPYVIICNWLFLVLCDYTACLDCRTKNPALHYCLYSDATWASWRHKQRPIYCLFNSMSWLATKSKSKLSHWKRYLCNISFLHLRYYPCLCLSAVWEIVFCSIIFTVTPHERHGVPNLRPLDNLLNNMSWLTPKETSKPSNWCFVALSLQWHNLSAMAFQAFSPLTVVQQYVLT